MKKGKTASDEPKRINKKKASYIDRLKGTPPDVKGREAAKKKREAVAAKEAAAAEEAEAPAE